ncbi:MAG TPA: ChaN family lipoprotein, partial [Blastocatellia bacterium]|nr:ChaN family lipoprotein [Blastocatellia bacterium]
MPRLVRKPRLAIQSETFQSHSQREVTEQLKRELMRLDPRARSQYVARFLNEFRQGEITVSLAEIMSEAAQADVIYLADYHALPATQAFAVRFLNLLVEQTRKQREIILCLENFYERDQRWIEEFISGEISEDRFLKLTRYATEWGYAWEGYCSILKAAEQHEIKVFGIDCPLRHQPRFIKKRDQNAASRIVRLLEKYPGAQIVVFFGESHLADAHLPKRTRQFASKMLNHPQKVNDLVIAQNIDELYWQFQNGAQMPGAVRVAANKYCVFTATPLEKYQSYARVIEQWQHHDEAKDINQAAFAEEPDFVSSCTRLLTTLLTALRLNSPRSWFRRARTLTETEPEIYSGCTFSSFAALLKRHGANADEVKALRARAQEIGCAYSSRINALFVSSFDVVSVSEELARYVIAALRGQLWS